MAKEIIRRCIFRPYAKGRGPTFTLVVWDTYRRHARGTSLLGYRLHMREEAVSSVIFEGEDFSPSPMHADDSDATIAGIMGFLCLKPGDTDREYFDGYSAAQIAFAESHAEYLEYEVCNRFGREH